MDAGGGATQEQLSRMRAVLLWFALTPALSRREREKVLCTIYWSDR